MSCYYDCNGKEKNNWNKLCIQLYIYIGPNHPISEIATSHVYGGLKRLEMRVIENCEFFKSKEWGHRVSGCSEVGDHEI